MCERAREKRARERDLAVANTLGTRQEHIRNPLGTETLLLRWPSARVGSRLSNRQRSSPGMFVIQNGTCQKKKKRLGWVYLVGLSEVGVGWAY